MGRVGTPYASSPLAATLLARARQPLIARSPCLSWKVNESKYEMEKLTRELQDVKRKYYEQKRRETLEKELRLTQRD